MKTSVQPAATHQRRIQRIGDAFKIEDEFQFDGEVTVRWRLSPDFSWKEVESGVWETDVNGVPYRLASVIPATTKIFQTEGLESLYYGLSQPCPVIEVKGKMKTLTTWVGPSADLSGLY